MLQVFATKEFMQSINCRVIGITIRWDGNRSTQMQVNLTLRLSEYVRIYNSVFYKMTQSVFNITEFTKSMLYNCSYKNGQVETWPT